MATQGIVSILVDGEVAMKIVTGSDGYNARLVAGAIRALGRVPSKEEALEMATYFKFGVYRRTSDFACPALAVHCPSLVIQTPDRDFYPAEPDLALSGLYREKFSDPLFNPRWERGTAPYCEVVRFSTKLVESKES